MSRLLFCLPAWLLFAYFTFPALLKALETPFGPPIGCQEPTTPIANEDRMVLVRVVDQANSPVPGATVQLNCSTTFDFVSRPVEADDAGVAIISVPLAAKGGSIEVYKPGFIPRIGRWGGAKGEIPDDVAFKLVRGTKIGGLVKNERDEPIAGARVELVIREVSTPIFSDPGPTNMLLVMEQLAPVTDADGRWTYSSAPADGVISLQVSHPDFVDLTQDDNRSRRDFTQDDIRKGEAVVVLSDGLRIEGTVRAEDGRAIAKPHLVMQQVSDNYCPPIETWGDDRGDFRFRPVAEGTYRVVCSADGYAPKMLKVHSKTDREPLSIRLPPGGIIRFRVVDPEDHPLAAFVSLEKCQDADWSFLNSYRLKPTLPTRTDAAGLFEWKWAPEGMLQFAVSAPGFRSTKLKISIDEQADEQVVRLDREAVLVGRVIDSSTREPIDRFVVLPFDVGTSIMRDHGVVGRNGKFELPMGRFESWLPKFHLMIEHDGHRSLLTDQSFSVSKLPKDLTLEMDAAEPISGVVVDERGRPLWEATVVLSERSTGLIKTRSMELGRALTEVDGKFRFLAPPGEFSIVATCDEGFLEKPFGQVTGDLGTFALKKWGGVEGQVLDRQYRPVAHRKVLIRRTGGGMRSCTTDVDGRFAFAHVRPGRCELIVSAENPGGKQVTKTVEVPPGETITVDIELD